MNLNFIRKANATKNGRLYYYIKVVNVNPSDTDITCVSQYIV